MNFKQIIGLCFGGVVAIGGLTASAVYLPQVVHTDGYFGTQLVDSQRVYNQLGQLKVTGSSSTTTGGSKTRAASTAPTKPAPTVSGIDVFNSQNYNGNIGHFIGGTPNVSLETLLNGTNLYSDGNYIVLFASDADPLSNQFLYNDYFTLDKKSGNALNLNSFGFNIDANNNITFDVNNVKPDYAAGMVQKAYQFLTNPDSPSLKSMAVLPSVVLVHDELNYEVMQSLISYKQYVQDCLHDVVVNLDNTFTFKVGSQFYNDYLKKNEGNEKNLGIKESDGSYNFHVTTSLKLFQNLVGYQEPKPDQQTDAETEANNNLSKEAEKLDGEYSWARDLKNADGIYYGFQFTPLNSSLEPNTYEGPNGETKLYRTDDGAKLYTDCFKLFKDKLSAAKYIDNGFTGNSGHYIGFAHSSIKNDCVLLGDELAEMPSSGADNLKDFAGKAAPGRFSASLISLYNGISNPEFKGQDLLRFLPGAKTMGNVNHWALNVDQKTESLRQYYLSK